MKYKLRFRFKVGLGIFSALVAFQSLESQTSFDWKLAGPVNTAGRIRNMLVDASDPSGKTLYCGSTTSGLFISKNGGGEWAPIDDQSKIRNISYLAQDASKTIWASTGEGFLRYGQKAKAQRGTGLYKLVGSVLTSVADSNIVGSVINRIACSVSGNKIAVASNKGIMISNDGGASFNLASGISVTANVAYGMDVKFDNAGILYCSVGNERGGSNASAIFDSIRSKVYKSTDANLTSFSSITPTSGVLTDFKYGRIELAIAPSNNNVIYASIANKNLSAPTGAQAANSANSKAIFVSYDAGVTWALLLQGSAQLDPLSNNGSISTGDYAHCLCVDPSNADIIYVGGYKCYKFERTNGSNTNPLGDWLPVGSYQAFYSPYYLHENIHDIKIIPGSPAKFYFITDAGIYRSLDMQNLTKTSFIPPSFQPFYKKLVTGQFNSVSIETFPIASAPTSTTSNAAQGQSVTPFSGFIGGTGSNGLAYYSGKDTLVTQESNYLSGDVYNTEYSKILDGSAFCTTGSGRFYRTANVKTTDPSLADINVYTGGISVVAPTANSFINSGFTTGTPFKLWENYGQIQNGPDKAIFFNDSVRLKYAISGISTLTTIANFNFLIPRPSRVAIIDSIAIRTATIVLPTSKNSNAPPFSGADKQDIFIKIPNTNLASNTIIAGYVGTTTVAIINTITPFNGTNIKATGPVSLAATGVTLNSTTLQDAVSVKFNFAPFASKTTASVDGVPDCAAYYVVYCTVFYKYKAGDTVSVVDNNISTKITTYSTVLTSPLQWSRSYVNVNPYGNGPHTGTNPAIALNKASNPLIKMTMRQSARLAMVFNHPGITSNQNAIVVSRAPLNLNDPLSFVRISQSGCLSDSTNGVASKAIITTFTGQPTIIEWSKSGTELYYATTENKLYRVSHITDIFDLSPSSYKGKFYTDCFTYASPINASALNPDCPYRTTLIGSFNQQISSISVSNDSKNLVITLNNPKSSTNTDGIVYYSTSDVTTMNTGGNNWAKKDDATLTGNVVYCSLMEKGDNKKVFLGTDNGMYYTDDITAATAVWSNVNNNQLPKVQIFDIKQQTLRGNECYNSGQIYVATNGRGVWTSGKFLYPYSIGFNEFSKISKENNLSLYPNPTNGNFTVLFNAQEGEVATLHIMDLNGRTVKTEYLGQLAEQEMEYQVSTASLATGVYIVNISSSSGIKRVSKLVVTK